MERLPADRELAAGLLARAREKGASQGDVTLAEHEGTQVKVRLGKVETVSQAHETRLGLRLFFGKSSAATSTSDLSRASLDRLLEETCAMARATAKDEFGGLPEPGELAAEVPDLDLLDGEAREMPVERCIDAARKAEEHALQHDSRITNSEGAEFGTSFNRIIHANSEGFAGEYATSGFRVSVAPVAASNGSMERDHWYSAARHHDGLDAPEAVGREAGRRVVRRLGARKVRTREVPVVFDAAIAGTLVRHVGQAVSGYALYQRASFLCDRLGEDVASGRVRIVDDGTIPAALGSRPFDSEGVGVRRKDVIEGGVLRSYLLDAYSARKLGGKSTGNATRGAGQASAVSPMNLHLLPGEVGFEDIIGSVEDGFYVTELMGQGVNPVTGDYSRGAAGIWIEKGELAYPVSELTIAGNLGDMLRGVEMVGNDLRTQSAVAAPTVKISRMTVAGD
jgi:PmbA protein